MRGGRVTIARLVVAFLCLGTSIPDARATRDHPRPGDTFVVPSTSRLLERLVIRTAATSPRPFVFGNDGATLYVGRTSGPAVGAAYGLRIGGRIVLRDYAVVVDDRDLSREAPTSIEVYPDRVIRRFANGIATTTSLADGVDALVVYATAASPHDWRFVPAFPEDSSALLTPEDGGRRLVESDASHTAVVLVATTVSRPPKASADRPGVLTVRRSRGAVFAVTSAVTKADALENADRLATGADAFVEARRRRIGRLLADSFVETADARFDRALAWIQVETDVLLSRAALEADACEVEYGPGASCRTVLASLPGASLASGRLPRARQILERCAATQSSDESAPSYGRVADRYGDAARYSVADTTCWFVREALAYVLASGDVSFANDIYGPVQRATDGQIARSTDDEGFLVPASGKGDASTSIDASGRAEGRRGNRAVEVEALWFAQLESAARLAHLVGDKEAAERWERQAARVKRAFRERFVLPRPNGLADSIDSAGRADPEVRANQLLALTIPFEQLLSAEEGRDVVRCVAGVLGSSSAVRSSIAADDRMWAQCAGPMISALVRHRRPDTAYELTGAMSERVLDVGAIGILARPANDGADDGPSVPETSCSRDPLGGAEFARVFYEDYLGIRVDAIAEQLALDPTPPLRLGRISAVIPYRGGTMRLVLIGLGAGRVRCTLDARGLTEPVEIVFGSPGPQGMLEGASSVMLRPGGFVQREWRRPPLDPRADLGVLELEHRRPD